MSRGLVGRAIALAGIVCGLLALGLPYIRVFELDIHYSDDGTSFAFLLVLLALASWFTSEVGRDLLAAGMGAAAFGFFLLSPATAAFDSLGLLGSGGWLGLCTILIPIGALVAQPSGARRQRRGTAQIGLLICTVALALVVTGIWLEAVDGGLSYWNGSSSGHAVGILMLVLVVLNLALIAGPVHLTMPDLGGLDVLVAAATFGFLEAPLVQSAFDSLGLLGAGAWIEACGGILLLVGLAQQRAMSPATLPVAAPAG